MNSWEKFDEILLPNKEDFYSSFKYGSYYRC